MKVTIINGSPKGKYSTTLYASLYLEKKFGDELDIINIGASPDKHVCDMSGLKESVDKADIIVFSYPVYTFLVPYQLHRIIEVLSETDILEGKFVTQITTSKHFFDVTAHEFINENILDMKARVIPGLSLDMDDVLKEEGQAILEKFREEILFRMENNIVEYQPVLRQPYRCAIQYEKNNTAHNQDKKAVIVTDNPSDNLKAMIDAFRDSFKYSSEIINLSDLNIKGGCLGCLNCVVNGKCVYKDDFREILDNTINRADMIVYAFDIKNHSMGSRFKMFDDRQFCNGHRTVNMGHPVAYIISGNIFEENNLLTVIKARADVGRNFFAGIASDININVEDSIKLAQICGFAIDNGLHKTQMFYGVGGMKIFRDMIYIMKGFMKEDHNFYKKNGFYDFPQKRKKDIIKMKLAGLLISNPKIRAKMKKSLDEIMIEPYKKMLENTK